MTSEPPSTAAPGVGGDGEPPLKDVDIMEDGYGGADGEDPQGTDGPGDLAKPGGSDDSGPLDQKSNPFLEVLPGRLTLFVRALVSPSSSSCHCW